MDMTFSARLAALRRARGLSQRQTAAELGVSQALLSHYETGAREPGLAFVCRACDYYGVTADFLLGRSGHPGDLSLRQCRLFLEELRGIADRADRVLDNIEGERA